MPILPHPRRQPSWRGQEDLQEVTHSLCLLFVTVFCPLTLYKYHLVKRMLRVFLVSKYCSFFVWNFHPPTLKASSFCVVSQTSRWTVSYVWFFFFYSFVFGKPVRKKHSVTICWRCRWAKRMFAGREKRRSHRTETDTSRARSSFCFSVKGGNMTRGPSQRYIIDWLFMDLSRTKAQQRSASAQRTPV